MFYSLVEVCSADNKPDSSSESSLGYSSFIHQTKVYSIKNQLDFSIENRLNYKPNYYLYSSSNYSEVYSAGN